MCRWLAYKGEPTYLETLISAPSHSLVAQSLRADEAKSPTNGDGFGVGWYGERDIPGLYREIRPAWSDENLRSLCAQVQARLFFAHVRASTGTAIARANCHPFAHGRFMFMHNGQVGNYASVKRAIEMLIPDALYAYRVGTTDSEALFLAALASGIEDDPVLGFARTLNNIVALMRKAHATEALRFTSALSDGINLYAFRWASDHKAPTLYYRNSMANLVVVSEPLDGERGCWKEVPQGFALIAKRGEHVQVRCMNEAMRAAA
jgi:predicted glutamine amidotransferase